MKDGVEKFIKSTVWVAIIFFGLRCGVSWKSIVENISIYDLFGYAGEAVGLATVIMAAYERWLWRINPFETTPALKKIYTGKIVSSYECFLLGIHTVRKVCGGYQPATAGF